MGALRICRSSGTRRLSHPESRDATRAELKILEERILKNINETKPIANIELPGAFNLAALATDIADIKRELGIGKGSVGDLPPLPVRRAR